MMKDNQTIFDCLLGDISREEFDARYWRKRFLFIPGAARFLLDRLPSQKRVEKLLDGEQVGELDGVRFISFPASGDQVFKAWWTKTAGADPRDPTEPINIPGAHRYLPELSELKQALECGFQTDVNLQLFFGCKGASVSPHSDLHDSIIIQIEGRKGWTIQDRNDDYLHGGNAGEEFDDSAVDIELGPGDVLYKPSCGIHMTRYLEDSVSLTASPNTLTLAQAVLSYLEQRLTFDQIWRTQLPLDRSRAQEIRLEVDNALREIEELLPTVEQLEAFVRRARNPESL